MAGYFQRLTEGFGQAWNQFWFTPSDPYTLSVLRVLVGLVATYSVFTYSFDLDRSFGPAGMLPPQAVRSLDEAGTSPDELWPSQPLNALPQLLRSRWHFSYLDYARTRAELWTCHLLGLGVLVLFTIGCYTRATSVLSLIVVLTYSNRALILTSEFEGVLAFVLFYICLGSSGACLSIDARRAGKNAAASAAPWSYSATICLRLIQVHLTVVYAMMVFGQLSAPAWWNGQAAWWLALNTQDALIDLTGLASHEYFFNFLTHLIVAYELAFSLLVWKPLTRPLMLGLGLIVWSIVAMLTGLISFCLVMMIANLAFVPGCDMRQLCSRFRAASAKCGP